MKGLSTVIVILVLGILTIAALYPIFKEETDVGDLASDFTLTDIDGNSFSLSDYRGKVVIIDFMAAGCVPCRMEMSHLKEIFSSYSVDQVVIMSIDVDPTESNDTIRQFKESYGDNWIFASGSDAGVTYGVTAIPTIYIIDTQGAVAYTGFEVTSSSTLSTEINNLL